MDKKDEWTNTNTLIITELLKWEDFPLSTQRMLEYKWGQSVLSYWSKGLHLGQVNLNNFTIPEKIVTFNLTAASACFCTYRTLNHLQ